MTEIDEVEEDGDDEPQGSTQKLRKENNQSIYDYVKELCQADIPVKVTLMRRKPKSWGNVSIEGTIEHFDEPISEEDIKEAYGGGVYTVNVFRTDGPKPQYVVSRTVKIAGNPKIDGQSGNGNAAPQASPESSVIRDAMRMSQNMVAQAQTRADRMEDTLLNRPPPNGNGETSQMLFQQMTEMQRSIAEKDKQLLTLATARHGERSTADVILEKMLDSDNARIAAIRTQVDSELRAKDENHRVEIDRVYQRHEDSQKRLDDGHKREVDQMRLSYEAQLATLKISYEGQIAGFAREISHLDRELTAAKTEAAELRARKEKSPVETISELAAFKEAISTLKDDSDEGGGSTFERVVGTIMNSPIVEGIASRVASGPVGPQAPPQPPQLTQFSEIPVNVPTRLADGRLVVRRPDGSLIHLKRPAKKVVTTSAGVEVVLDPVEVATAVQFMENAIQNETDPESFASAARHLVPGHILEALRAQGVDAFLANVAKLQAGSPLSSQHGKTG